MRHLSFDRRIPLGISGALVAGLLLQAAAALWWAAQQASTISFIERRVITLEGTQTQSAPKIEEVLVRLARIEERLHTQTQALADIRQRMGR